MIKILPTVGEAIEVNGTRWTVSETGELHVYRSSGNQQEPVASFARGTWLSTQVLEDEKN